MNNFEEILRNALYLICAGVVPLLIRYVVVYLQVKINENSAKINNNKIEQYLFATTDVLEKVVLTVNQTYVDQLKQSNSFTEEAQEAAKNMAIEKTMNLLTEESKKAIEMLYGDLTEYLEVSIEALVRANKVNENKTTF